jgi:hypothetical protein
MKTSFFLAALVLGWVGAGALRAADPAVRAEVIFDHPDKFTDIKDQAEPTDSGEQAILEQIRSYLVAESKYYVPDGDKLTITFTDIDLAGDFEPERGPRWDQIRIVKDIYPPHFKFTWSVTDASGAVVKQGKEDILDMSFQMRVTLDTQDPLRYEKDILRSWMSGALRSLKKG